MAEPTHSDPAPAKNIHLFERGLAVIPGGVNSPVRAFGAAAGDSGKGYYSYDLGPYWHVVSLNSEIPMDAGSPQEVWLRADLDLLLLQVGCRGQVDRLSPDGAEEARDQEQVAGEEDAGEEEALGSTLIGDIEGPTIITDEAAFPAELNEAPMLPEKVEAETETTE